jgi:hypothetical protein
MGVDFGRVDLTLQKEGFRPQIILTPDHAFFHSGQGARPPVGTFLPPQLAAWTATAKVKFALSNNSSLSGWRLGFIQVAKQKQLSRRYIGKTRKDGSCTVDYMKELPKGFAIDCMDGVIFHDKVTNVDTFVNSNPFTIPATISTGTKNDTLVTATADHPHSFFALFRENSSCANADNLLFSAVDEVEFVTVLVAQAPDNGNFVQLGHFNWSAFWEVRIDRWFGKDGRDSAGNVLTFTRFKFDDPFLPLSFPDPTEALRGLSLDGRDMPINTLISNAFGHKSNYTEIADWPPDTPREFYVPQ